MNTQPLTVVYILPLVLFFALVAVFTPSAAHASGVSDFQTAYFLLNDYRGANLLGRTPFNLSSGCCSYTGSYLNETASSPAGTGTTSPMVYFPTGTAPTYAQYAGSGLKMYVMYVSSNPLNPLFGISGKTASPVSSYSSSFSKSSMAVYNNYATGGYIGYFDSTTTATTLFHGNTGTSTIKSVLFYGFGTNYQLVGVVWSYDDESAAIATSSSASDAYTIMQRLIQNATTSTSTPPPPSATGKYIKIIAPTYGTTTASTTVHVSVDYSTPFSLDFRPTTTRSYIIRDAVTGVVEYEYSHTLDANAAESLNVSMDISLATGSKIMQASYQDENGNAYSEVPSVFFNVISNTYLIATGRISPSVNGGEQTQIDCGSFDVGCQFQKAISFLLYPTAGSLDKFTASWHIIASKKPFGYIPIFIDAIGSLNDTGTPLFDLGTIPFMDTIFTPFKIAVGGLLWGIFAIVFYNKRLRHLDI